MKRPIIIRTSLCAKNVTPYGRNSVLQNIQRNIVMPEVRKILKKADVMKDPFVTVATK